MSRRRSSGFFLPLFGLLALVLIGALGVLLVNGRLELFGFELELREDEVQANELGDGMVLVPISVARIPAYTRIDAEHVFDTEKGQFSTIALPEDTLPETIFTIDDYLAGELRGRVLKRDKPKGKAFTESDFLPKGAREGITAGIPPGKRGMVLPVSDVEGLMDLRRGDHFDIVGTWEPKTRRATPPTITALAAGSQPTPSPEQPRPGVDILVTDGQIISPVSIRAAPTSATGLFQGQRLSATPIEEVRIAVTPEEAVRIAAALQTGAKLRCLIRSGHPDDDGAPTTMPAEFLEEPTEAPDNGLGEVLILGEQNPTRILTRRSSGDGH